MKTGEEERIVRLVVPVDQATTHKAVGQRVHPNDDRDRAGSEG